MQLLELASLFKDTLASGKTRLTSRLEDNGLRTPLATRGTVRDKEKHSKMYIPYLGEQ